MSLMPRFIKKFRVGPNKDDCWIWTACKSPQGYGLFSASGKQTNASRFAYEFFIGPIPRGSQVCHSCDNPACVNPDHLWLGTQKDNIRDMYLKGRDYNGHDKITRCPSGHWYTEENTRIYRNKRICRQCDRDRNKDNPKRLEAGRLRSARNRRTASANRRVGNI